MEVIIDKTPEISSANAAAEIAKLLKAKPRAVLGCATGGTPLKLYADLISMCENGEISFAGVRTFNLDEYVGLGPDDPNSYRRFMDENFFDRIDIKKSNTRVPDGLAKDIPAFCSEYEKEIKDAGGIDLQILGLGSDGHIGFNEPSSSLCSRTRIKTLAPQTLLDNARFFGGNADAVPKYAITMGIGTIMDARSVVLLAFGEGKADAVAKMVEGGISAMLPASVLQMHENAKVFVDEAAASKLANIDYYKYVRSMRP